MITGAFAGLLTKTSESAFSDATIDKTKMHILDTIGVSLAGARSFETQKMLEVLHPSGNEGHCAVWGTSYSTNARTAALINGVSAHAYELDDSGGCDHSGAVVLPAAIAALADIAEPVTGAAFLRSIILGYEVGRRVLEAAGGYETHNGLGWHSTGTCGVFGAAAAVGSLLKLNRHDLSSALGTACSFAAGTWAFIGNGSSAKKLHSGRAAEAGILASCLARGGFQGPEAVFEPDQWGSFFATYCGDHADPQTLIRDYGVFWRINRCSIKPYATCRGTHSAIDAINLIFTKASLNASNVAKIEVGMSAFQFGMCGSKSITTRAQAQMSLPYAMAARLHYGKVFLDELANNAWEASEIADWLDKMTIEIDKTMADEDEPEVRIITHNGDEHRLVVEAPLGGPDNPLSVEQITRKYHDLSKGILPVTQVDAIRELILNLEKTPDVRALLPLLQSPMQN
ncbi:MmgE/PrpD family protein [Brucella thiophenivorans]|uniref:MmgE/PrpD family protein n=1 Tax=Brucella thiophenivorans TaxID=571255 RepID=A0A256FA95_9HYPH|nr:MmgE/PrpD family protein [Brucella thiophenivorans]OYR11693.1 mmgE/PrpD family protein [Brucella thiophenivorans]